MNVSEQIAALFSEAPTASSDRVADIILHVGHLSGELPPADAVQPVAEAVQLAHGLTAGDPAHTGYWHRYGWIQVVLAQRLEAAGRPAETATPARTAVEVLLGFPPAAPANLRHDAVHLIGVVCGYLPANEAAEAAERAVQHARALTTEDPANAEYRHRYGWIQVVLAQRLEAAGRPAETATPARTAVEVLLGFPPAAPANLRHDAVHLIGVVCGYLPANEAAEAVKGAVQHARHLLGARPANADYRARLAWALRVLADRLTANGQPAEAASARWEASAVDLATHEAKDGLVPSPYVREITFGGAALSARSRHPDYMNVFAVSTGGRVWEVEWHGHWNHPEPIRARAFPPATVLVTLSRRLGDDDWIDMQAFAVSADGHVWVAGWHHNEWFEWEQIGARAFPSTTPLATLSRSFDFLDVFAVDSEGQVWVAWWHGGWNEWVPIGTHRFHAGTALAAVSRNPDYMDLFAVDSEGQVWVAWWHGGWNEWIELPVASEPLPDDQIPFGNSRVFMLSAPIERRSTVGEREPLVCTTAEVTCSSDGTWTFVAYLENHETEADCEFDLQWSVIGTPKPFGQVMAGRLSAAGDGYVTEVGWRTAGVPPAQTFRRSGTAPELTDPGFWRAVFKAASRFELVPAWVTYPEPEPEDPDPEK